MAIGMMLRHLAVGFRRSGASLEINLAGWLQLLSRSRQSANHGSNNNARCGICGLRL